MTSDKMYELVCKVAHGFGGDYAEYIIKNPHEFMSSENSGMAALAELLIEAKKADDKKTTKAQVIGAAKRIIKNAEKYINDKSFHGIFDENGKFSVSDGYRVVRFNADIASLPHVRNDFSFNDFFENCKNDEVIDLPKVVDVKMWMAEKKAAGNNTDTYPLAEGIFVNPKYLIDMLQALPGCKAYKPEKSNCPIYFEAETGDGILLPVRTRRS